LNTPRILMIATAFHPRIGGYETFARLLASGLADWGRVTVATDTLADKEGAWPFEVLRQPAIADLLKLACAADLVVVNSMTLKYFLRLLPALHKVVVIHHTAYEETYGLKNRVLEPVKRAMSFFVPLNICVSKFVASRLYGTRVVIPNGYDDEVFVNSVAAYRIPSILFVGRLVREKGVDTLIRACALIQDRLPGCKLTIVGDGAEMSRLNNLARDIGVTELVTFTGQADSEQVAAAMRAHRILVVPSIREPFGIVVLEGLASGCDVVHSDAGGLCEAAGGLGRSFQAGNPQSLAQAILDAAQAPCQRPVDQVRARNAYLERCSCDAMIRSYSNVLASFTYGDCI
jgi:glycosyltransferase involved in cell wall biosynthesis